MCHVNNHGNIWSKQQHSSDLAGPYPCGWTQRPTVYQTHWDDTKGIAENTQIHGTGNPWILGSEAPPQYWQRPGTVGSKNHNPHLTTHKGLTQPSFSPSGWGRHEGSRQWISLLAWDKPISDVFLWTPSHGRAMAGQTARTYILQLCVDTRCSPEELSKAMNNREGWRERVRDIHADGVTWWLFERMYYQILDGQVVSVNFIYKRDNPISLPAVI